MFNRFVVLLSKALFRSLIPTSALVGALMTLIVGAQSSFACLTPGSMIGGFDNDIYVFLGKVKGHTSASVLQGASSEVFGLRVEVTDRVFPMNGPSEYVVFPTRTMADCTRGGLDIKELTSTYPLGLELRVVAQLAEGIGMRGSVNAVLEAGYKNHTGVSRNPAEAKKGRTFLSTEFDYKLADNAFLDSSAERYYYVAFEVQKDLVRLERAKTDTERQSILKRLRNAPVYAQLNFDLIEAIYTMSRPSLFPNNL